MSALAPETVAVRRVRVVAHGRDHVGAQLAADRLLAAASLATRGVAPAEILVVRALRDPLPGACGRAPSGTALARWRAAVEARFEQLRASAARPAAELVPDGADAVLFGDLAELLMCLTIDAAAGVAAARWWWRSWLRDAPSAGAVAGAWTAHAEQAPAAVALLARRGAVDASARALSPAEAADVSRAVARAFAVDVDVGVDGPGVSVIGRPPGGHPSAVDEAAGDRAAAPAASTAALRAALPELRSPGLAREHRHLVGLCLALCRRPDLVRARRFAAALHDAVDAVPQRPPPPAAAPRARSPRSTSVGGPAAGGPPASARTAALEEPRPDARAPGARGDGPRATGPRDEPGGPTGPPWQPSTATAPAPTRVAPPPHPDGGHGPAPAPDATATELGGLFLLPGVALYLELYGDFSRPREPGLALDPWDLTALLGHALLPRAARRDPAWRLLAELLAPFGPGRGRWRWHDDGLRLRARHPSGFLALDVARRGDAGAQLARELERLGSPPARSDPALPVRPATGSLDRWVGAWLAPYVAARLRLALGARRPSAAVALTLRRRARVAVTPGRVDVTFSLDDLPVALRRAGLDRTPGWIPAARRHLAFHFR